MRIGHICCLTNIFDALERFCQDWMPFLTSPMTYGSQWKSDMVGLRIYRLTTELRLLVAIYRKLSTFDAYRTVCCCTVANRGPV